MMNIQRKFSVLLICVIIQFIGSAQALTLVAAYEAAKAYDPFIREAQATSQINQYQAIEAYTTFLPTMTYGNNRVLDYNNGTSSQLNINQPIVSLEKIYQFEQGKFKRDLATTGLSSKELDLTQRLFNVIANIVNNNQAIKSNAIKLENLEKNITRAKRMYELGQGTVTSIRDFESRYELSKATALTLQITKRNLQHQLANITGGINSTDADFVLRDDIESASTFDTAELLLGAKRNNPLLLAARDQEEIAILDTKRSRSQILPTVSLGMTKTWGGAVPMGEERATINISIPIDAPRVINVLSASANVDRATEIRRQTELQVELQAKQLKENIDIGRDTLRVKREAINSAQQSLDANLKSAQAGVVTTIQVLNSIDILYQAQTEYVSTAVTVASSILGLFLSSGYQPVDALSVTETYLFKNTSGK
jgi:outer membrane protein TolC